MKLARLCGFALPVLLSACFAEKCGAQAAPPMAPPATSPAPTTLATPSAAQAPTQGQSQVAQPLTLTDAEAIAIKNHPLIQAATQLARAATEQLTEVRSAYYPQASGAMTGAMSESGEGRIGAGTLNSPHIFDKFSPGFAVTQLITDFGRTHELSKSSNYHAQAQQANVVTSRADVLLQVNVTYFDVLKAQALLRVADDTVKARQLVSDQVTEMFKSNLKSGLDVSFANVDLANAQLLLVTAQNNVQAAYAAFSEALGYPNQRTFSLAEEQLPAAPPPNAEPLIDEALQNRPEIVSSGLDLKSAQSYATAERDLWFPTLSAIGVAGLIPVGEDNVLPTHYAAAGFNLNIPIFNGFLFNAYHREAVARATAQSQYLRDLQDRIAQDVRTSWLNLVAGYQRLSVTQQLLTQATQAYDLAQARYKLGLSSIIELSQAQLNLTQAQIEQIGAQYDYENETANLNYQLGRMR